MNLKAKEHLLGLEEKLTRRFQDLKEVELEFDLLSYQFSAVIEFAPEDLRFELID